MRLSEYGAGSWAGRRVVRGGSWNNNQRNARCACRNNDNPDNFNTNNGFRVVLAPITRRSGRKRRQSNQAGGFGLVAGAKNLGS